MGMKFKIYCLACCVFLQTVWFILYCIYIKKMDPYWLLSFYLNALYWQVQYLIVGYLIFIMVRSFIRKFIRFISWIRPRWRRLIRFLKKKKKKKVLGIFMIKTIGYLMMIILYFYLNFAPLVLYCLFFFKLIYDFYCEVFHDIFLFCYFFISSYLSELFDGLVNLFNGLVILMDIFFMNLVKFIIYLIVIYIYIYYSDYSTIDIIKIIGRIFINKVYNFYNSSLETLYEVLSLLYDTLFYYYTNYSTIDIIKIIGRIFMNKVYNFYNSFLESWYEFLSLLYDILYGFTLYDDPRIYYLFLILIVFLWFRFYPRNRS